MAKEVTRAQAERKKAQAAEFLDRLGEPDRAEEFDEMSVDEYAERKGLRLTNPRIFKRRKAMAKNANPSRGELQERLDNAIDLLDDAYAPETTREDLAEAVGKALDVLKGEEEEEDDEED